MNVPEYRIYEDGDRLRVERDDFVHYMDSFDYFEIIEAYEQHRKDNVK